MVKIFFLFLCNCCITYTYGIPKIFSKELLYFFCIFF